MSIGLISKITPLNDGFTGLVDAKQVIGGASNVLPDATMPDLTGDVTTSEGAVATTIANKAVTLAKMDDMATSSFIGRKTAGAGVPEVLNKTDAQTILNVADGANAYTHPNHSGDVTSVADGATTIAAKAVDVAMLADGTDGQLITWGADGVATTVATGDAGEVLTSAGAGAPPTFAAASGGVADGDKGDITVSGSGATWTIDNGVVTLAKQADMNTASLVGRNTAGAGAPEVITDIPTAVTIGTKYVYRADGTDIPVADGGTGASTTASAALNLAVTPIDGWINPNHTWTYATASTFTVEGDVTATYQKGTRLKWTQTTVKYGVVVSSAYSDPNTTVTIAVNNEYTIANAAISENYYSYVVKPQGYPANFTYTPNYSAAGSMTYTSVTTSNASFIVTGNIVFIRLMAYGTTGGTPSTVLLATPPITSDGTTYVMATQFRDAASGSTQVGSGFMQSNYLYCMKNDVSTYGTGTGRYMILAGYYTF